MSVVLHFQSTGSIPGDGRPVSMVGNSLTIGRGNDNDLVLPDPDRVISTRHCAIEDQNGNVVVIDFSTNGTFLNYGKIPLGRVPTPLNDGDILSIGNYELAVDLTMQKARGGPELLDPVGGGSVAPSGARPDRDLVGLLDAPAEGDDFINDLLAPGNPVGPKGIKRPELGDDGLLPPLGEEDAGDPLLAGSPDPDAGMGASQAMDSPSVQDHMPIPQISSSAIPDDWDLDLPSSPIASEAPAVSGNPFDEPEAVTEAAPGIDAGGAFIPDDLDLDFGAPAANPTKEASGPGSPALDELGHDAFAEQPAAPLQAPSSEPERMPPTIVERPSVSDPGPAASTRRDAIGAKDGLGILLRAAGLSEAKVPTEEREETARRLGNVFRILVHGMREILMTRTSIKSEFRIDQTRISASGNNPLKFSVTPEQAVEVMVSAPKRGYLSAEAAAEQALQDIKAHEVATMTGMEAALKGVLQKLSPEALEGQISSAGGIGDLLKGRKARYWETYERIYSDVADAAENDFHELFSREFARAYQEQLDKLKDET